MSAQTILIFAGLGVLALVLAAQNWRHAFLMVVVAGFAQDAIRKMTPGEPVIIVMLSSLMMGVALLVAMSRVGMFTLRPLTQGNRTTHLVMVLFIGLVLLQAVMAYVRYKHPVIPAIGLIAYLGPIPAVWLAYRFLRSDADLVTFIRVYVAFAVVLGLSIALEKFGFQSRIFGQVGDELIVFDPVVGIVRTYSGILRSPEVAAWHLGTACCLMAILVIAYRGTMMKLVTPPLVIALLAVATLTGRRKVLVVVAAFAVIYFALLMYFRQRSGTRALFIVGAIGLVVAAATLFLAPERSALDPYMTRGGTVFGDVWERFERLGLASVGWALAQAGPWGVGAGAVSQGTQYFGGASWAIRGAAEGGLGKIIVELGVIGLLLIVLAGIRVAHSVRQSVRVVVRSGDHVLLRVNLGLLAFCAANVPVFVGASQIYGDPFVLFVLGSCIGFVLAGPRLVDLKARAAARRAALERQGASGFGSPPLPVPAAYR